MRVEDRRHRPQHPLLHDHASSPTEPANPMRSPQRIGRKPRPSALTHVHAHWEAPRQRSRHSQHRANRSDTQHLAMHPSHHLTLTSATTSSTDERAHANKEGETKRRGEEKMRKSDRDVPGHSHYAMGHWMRPQVVDHANCPSTTLLPLYCLVTTASPVKRSTCIADEGVKKEREELQRVKSRAWEWDESSTLPAPHSSHSTTNIEPRTPALLTTNTASGAARAGRLLFDCVVMLESRGKQQFDFDTTSP